MTAKQYDAIVLGAGPNGLSAAIQLARSGLSVGVFEAEDEIGGGVRTAELTLPGFHHDICSAIVPMALISPFFQSLPLQSLGIEWIQPPVALAHPFDREPAAVLYQSVEKTAEQLGADGQNYLRLMSPLAKEGQTLMEQILKPIRFPKHPFLMARFGLSAMRSASALATSTFKTSRARAFFAGCAAHSIVSLDQLATASFGIVLALGAHLVGWPLIKGGSQQLISVLANYFRQLGGEIHTNQKIASLKDLPLAKVVLLGLTPRQIAKTTGDELPKRFVKKMTDFRYGPGVFKIDWALDGPIPWKDPLCSQAGTVHLGCNFEEILVSEHAIWNGTISERPFVLLSQQSLFDATRAPSGKHTGWAYCHVPNGCTVDMTDAIENQVERFAPGFRSLILARHVLSPATLEKHNQNLIGGDISGGANNFGQVLARPVLRWDPYATPNPRIFICSSSTPPGGGVHGMCGFNAANSALRKVFSK